jgi:hypothetical protein
LAASSLLAIGDLGNTGSTDVFTVNASSELVRIDMLGDATVIGTGFGSATDMEFGADGALYVSEFANDQVLRISVASAVPSSGAPLLITLFLVLGIASMRQLVAAR